MIGNIFFREIRSSFKSLLVLCFMLLLYAFGFLALYPAYQSMITSQTAQQFSQNPLYMSLIGGNGNILDVRGFIDAEILLLWTIVAGMFVAYLSVSFVAGDFENRYMDILLSKPVTRRRYLIEKFLAMTVISIVLTLVSAIGIVAGLSDIGDLNVVSASTVFATLIGAIPVLMVVAAIGILVSVVFRKVRTGMGIGFTFVFAQLFMRIFGTMSTNLDALKTTSIFQYWDYASVMFNNVFKAGDFIGLTILSFLILIVSIFIFERTDIPQ